VEVVSPERLFPGMHISKIRGRALGVGAALVVTIALMSACSAEADPAARTFTEPSGPELVAAPWLLFQEDAGARQEVAMIRTDGTDQMAPFHDLAGGDQTNPDWSPDGSRVVFAMSDGEREDLWVADADGSNARVLIDCAFLCRWLDDPDWSPDGAQIVYSRTILRPNGWGIGTLETVDVATGKTRIVLGPWRREFTAGARYSPSGRQIVFEKVHKAQRGPDSEVDGVTLSVVRLDRPGHKVRSLTDPQLYAATADWSPDGQRIVYSALGASDGEAPDLFWIRPGGGTPTRITSVSDDGGFAAEPSWLPDGSGVFFSGHLVAGPGSPELLRVNVDGTGLGSALGDSTIYGRHPRIQPGS
jgi:Tol biopolymer transport system component